MRLFPEELKYTESHEWVHKSSDEDVVIVGVTEFAQEQLGELVTVELPEVDHIISAGDDVCVLESVKAATDVLSPLTGKIIAINEDLEDAPGLVNTDPYGDGWLYKLHLKDIVEYDELLSAEDYQEYLAELNAEDE